MSRPSESITAAVGSILGAIFILLGAFDVDLPAEAQGAVVVLVSWIAAGVTWYVARRQRAGLSTSGPDGTVS